jgi:osmotically-inducible protein OsmY
MKTTTLFAIGVASSLALGAGLNAMANAQKDETTQTSGKTTKAHHHHHKAEPRSSDNTGVNKRDRNSDEPTAGQQANQKSDEKLTAEIRRAITTDKALSFGARNVKVITHDGRVTLKGPVGSAEEKRSIEQKAEHLAGAEAVTSELEVKQQ